MMPTSPRYPLSFRTAGFPQYGWKDGGFGRRLPNAPLSSSLLRHTLTHVLVCFRPSCIPSYPRMSRSVSGGYAPMHRRGGWVILSQGSSLESVLCCPVCHHLIDPIRPHSQAHHDFAARRALYAMPSLCGSA